MTIWDQARELAIIHSVASTMGWDQETYLPPAASEYRAKQLAWLSAQAHRMATSDAWRQALEAAEAADDGSQRTVTANLREMRRQFKRATRLPVELVAREAAATSLAKHAWAEARRDADFGKFAPHLDGLLEIARRKADLWGYADEPYDALLDGYERNTSTAAVAALFESMAAELRESAARAVAKSAARAAALPAGPYPVAAQKQFNAEVVAAIGFDFAAGRIDTTQHPFCTTLGPRDVRLTCRYDEGDFTSSLFGTLHEAGHGLYELGLPAEDFGLPSGSPVSLGIHESQSRLWENHVGRSRGFWQRWLPVARGYFPQLAALSLDDMLAWLWRAEYSPIRVEADESTYDLHIVLRFDLERKLLDGSLAVADVPAAWNERCVQLLGKPPANDREGCLQDIHWAMGGLGYFPTYTLGNIHAAQLFAAAKCDPAIAAGLEAADYPCLLDWLRRRVHAHGGTLDPCDLIRHATGREPSTRDYLAHLHSRSA